MSTLFNSQQNININISYNLGPEQDVQSKTVGRRINKNTKVRHRKPFPADIKIRKTQNKKSQNKKQQNKETKPESRMDIGSFPFCAKMLKTKKKVVKQLQNLQLVVPERRYKTETGHYQQSLISRLNNQSHTQKKEMLTQGTKQILHSGIKSKMAANYHLRSIHQNFSKAQHNSNSSSLPNNVYSSQMKSSFKQQKNHHNRSCTTKGPDIKHLYPLDIIGAPNIVSVMNAHSLSHGQSGHSGHAAKRRVQSAGTIVHKNDKIVSKLLNMNMSLLGSEMGGSQVVPISDLRGEKNNPNYQRMLKEFMSSLDMNIIKHMQEDNPPNHTILQALEQSPLGLRTTNSRRYNSEMVLISYLVNVEKIPFEVLNEKAILIQRTWRRQMKRQVVSYYGQLFKNVMRKKAIGHGDLSLIQLDSCPEQESYDNRVTLIEKQLMAGHLSKNSLIRQNNNEEGMESLKFINREAKNSWFKETHDQEVPEKKQRNLNINKYKQLVDLKKQQTKQQEKNERMKQRIKDKIEKSLSQSRSVQEEFSESNRDENIFPQINQHWNQINRLISNNMHNHGTIDSQKVLEELIKQSTYNKKWIQQDLEVSSNNQSADPRQVEQVSEHSESQLDCEVNWKENREDLEPNNQLKKEGDSLGLPAKSSAIKDQQFDDFQQYNCKKYTHNQTESINDELQNSNRKPVIESYIDEMSGRRNVHQEFMGSEGSMKNYLDCGLYGFGLNLPHLMQEEEEKHFTSYNYDQDQPSQKVQCQLEQEIIDPNDVSVRLGIAQMLPQKTKQAQQPLTKKITTQKQALHQFLQRQNQQRQQHIRQLQSKEVTFVQATGQSSEDQSVQQELFVGEKNKNVNCIVEEVVEGLMNSLAADISVILQRSSKRSFGGSSQTNSHFQSKSSSQNSLSQSMQFRPRRGIPTGFQAIKEYLFKLKEYILGDQRHGEKVLKNLNRVIGPSSLEILSYLRITGQEDLDQYYEFNGQEEDQDQDHLYVVPTNIFSDFEIELHQQAEKINEDEMHKERMKPYKNFFHRALFQAYNECLDYEKPYGIAGRPYQWTTQPRMHHRVSNLRQTLQNACGRLLELTSFLSGIIFDKEDSPFSNTMIEQQHKQQINQERLSRMLANQLFDTEETWVNYNDQTAELYVQISRLIEERVYFEACADLKKIARRRKILSFHNQDDQEVVELHLPLQQ